MRVETKLFFYLFAFIAVGVGRILIQRRIGRDK